MSAYHRRVMDEELDELLPHLPAVSLDGPRGVGKTTAALQRAGTVFRLDDGDVRLLRRPARELGEDLSTPWS